MTECLVMHVLPPTEPQSAAATADVVADHATLLRAITASSPAGVFLTDANGICVYANRCWAEMAGLEPEHLLGQPWERIVHPADRDLALRRYRDALRLGGTWRLEFRVQARPDRTTRALAVGKTLCDPAGQITGCLGIVIDIGPQKAIEARLAECERRYAKLLSAAGAYRYSVAVEGGAPVSTDHGPGCTAATGYTPDDYALQPTLWIDMVHPEDRDLVRQHAAMVMQEVPLPQIEHRIWHKSGEVRWVRNTIVRHHDEQGTLVGYDGLIEDLTEWKRSQQLAAEREAELLAAQRIQEHLLPERPPVVPGYDIAGSLVPAEFAAGDYYDYLTMPDGTLGIVVGDVCGHGFSAALVMASISAHLRSFIMDHTDVRETLRHVNTFLCREAGEGRFVTLVFLQLEPASRRLNCLNLGHPPGYVLGPSGEVKRVLCSDSLPLAILPDIDLPCGAPFTLEPEDSILLTTDGFFESRSPEGAPFGQEKMLETFRALRNYSAMEIIRQLQQTVFAFTGLSKPQDDLTAVVIKVAPSR